MNRYDVSNMPAGVEIDILIAENVLGWTNVHLADYGNGGKQWEGDSPKAKYIRLPNYSKDIAAAWQVIDYFISTSRKRPKIDRVAEGDWRVQIDDFNENAAAFSHSAPLAICRAALLAVMKE